MLRNTCTVDMSFGDCNNPLLQVKCEVDLKKNTSQEASDWGCSARYICNGNFYKIE